MLFVYMLIVLSFLLSYSVFLYFVYDFNNNNNNRFYSLPVHIIFAISLPSSLHDPLGRRHWPLLHPQAQSSLKITNRSFRYAVPHLWNKLPPSLRVPCQSAISAIPSPGSDSAPKSVVGVSHGVFHPGLKTHLFSRSFPRNLPLSLTD